MIFNNTQTQSTAKIPTYLLEKCTPNMAFWHNYPTGLSTARRKDSLKNYRIIMEIYPDQVNCF